MYILLHILIPLLGPPEFPFERFLSSISLISFGKSICIVITGIILHVYICIWDIGITVLVYVSSLKNSFNLTFMLNRFFVLF